MERPIGVIDSGVGGLTVLHEMMRQLPREKLIYLGDTKRCPYGPRKEAEIKKFTWEMVDFLLEQNIKALVIACNTATAFAMEELKDELEIPIIGVITPGARAAIHATKNQQIGIIGTEGTVRSGAYPAALKQIDPDIKAEVLACPTLVPMVEKGIFSGRRAKETVQTALEPFTGQELDTLILGCTHYPLLKYVIQEVVGEGVSVISSSEETARETSTILEVNHLQNKEGYQPVHDIYSTGDMEVFHEIMKKIFPYTEPGQFNIKPAVIEKD